MKKWLEIITDPDFIVEHSKKIIAIVSAGVIACLIAMFLLQAHHNVKSEKEKSLAEQERNDKNQEEREDLVKEKQQQILSKTLVHTFSFEDLSYKAPDTTKSSTALLNTTDFMIDSYKDYLLMSTTKENLYFYNITNGRKDYVTDMAIYNQVNGKYLYYVEVVDSMGSELKSYNIETKKIETINNLDYTQSIGGAGRVGNIVYYILNENGKSHLTVRVLGDKYDVGKNIRNMNIELPTGSYLEQEGEKLYMINTTGYYLVKDGSLQRLGDAPKLVYNNVKMYNGKPIVYGYNLITKQNQLIYNGKVLMSSNNIFDYNPINEKYFLINNDNDLMIMNIETVKTKRITDSAASSAVVNGDIFFSIDKEMHTDTSTNFYLFEKK